MLKENFEKPPSEEKREELKVEKEIPRPWEIMELEEEKNLLEKYREREGVELSKETQKSIGEILKREVDERKIEFAKEWFEEHKEDLEAEGISLEVSDEKKALIAIEKGAFEELRKKEEYRERYEQIENLNALRVDLGKKYLPIESQFLLLNALDKKAEKTKERIEEMKKEGLNELEISIKEKELEDLFKLRKELAEKVSGRNLEKEAKEEAMGKFVSKEKYIEDQLFKEKRKIENNIKMEIFKKEWEKLLPEEQADYNNDLRQFAEERIEEQMKPAKGVKLDEKAILAFRQAGYNPEEFKLKGLFRKKIEIKEGEKISLKEFQDFKQRQIEKFDKEIEEKAKEELGTQWDSEYQRIVKERMEEKIKELAGSPERAKEGVEGVYRKIKDRLIAEWAEKDLKKEKKTEEELKAIEREFSKEGKNPIEFISDILSRKGKLSELTGDLEKDEKKLRDFLGGYGIKTKEGDLAKFIKPEKYQKEVRREKGLLELLIELTFKLITLPLEIAAEASKKEKK